MNNCYKILGLLLESLIQAFHCERGFFVTAHGYQSNVEVWVGNDAESQEENYSVLSRSLNCVT